MGVKLPKEVREFFRRQGSIGGKRRKRNLSAAKRSEIARKAVLARWAKAKRPKERQK